jgi:hypothetical protein
MNTETDYGATRQEYRRLTPFRLFEGIVEQGDRQAIREILRRRFFQWGGGPALCLVDFVMALRSRLPEKHTGRFATEVLDKAYEIAIDKFSRLPECAEGGPSPQEGGGTMPACGVDCRNYYRSLVKIVREKVPATLNPLERDAQTVVLFQRFVIRHFNFALKEAVRTSNVHVQRYAWTTDGETYVLHMPRAMTGEEKRRWLEEHVPPPWRNGPGSLQRIQTLVDQRLMLDAEERHRKAVSRSQYGNQADRPWSLEYECSQSGLAGALAAEKALHIDAQRPSIQALGRERLTRLVQDVFAGLARGAYHEGRLARRYGLSRSTFSRFCGSEWCRGQQAGRKRKVPDLWANLAGLMARHEGFREAAQAASVWDTVQAVVRNSRMRSREELTP